MPTKSNWPAGFEPNRPSLAPRRSRYEGMGGWEEDSHDIPLLPAAAFLVKVLVFVWALFKLPLLIWG